MNEVKVFNTNQIDKQLRRIEQYLARKGLPLETLEPDAADKVLAMSTDLYHFYKVDYAKAIEHCKEGAAIVHSENTIYYKTGKNNVWIRRKVMDKEKYICHYCGAKGDTVDHIIPVSKGGKDTLENLVCCCQRCNGLKGDMSYESFVKAIKKVGLSNLEEQLKRLSKPRRKKEFVGYNKHGIAIYRMVNTEK